MDIQTISRCLNDAKELVAGVMEELKKREESGSRPR
jgi:hypothetical protein